MKNIILFILAAFACLTTACSDQPLNQELYPYKENDKWGYINQNGDVIVRPQFEDARDFVGDYATVLLDDNMSSSVYGPMYKSLHWGIIDKTGKIQLKDLGPFYGDISVTDDGFVIGSLGASVGETRCLIIASIKDGKELFPLIDKQIYCDEMRFETKEAFQKEGMLAYHDINEGLWGFLDMDGEIAIKPQFTHVIGFFDGIASVQDNESEKYYLIDKTGKKTTEHEYESMIFPLAPDLYSVAIGDKFAFINSKGQIVVDPKFDDIVDGFNTNDLLYVKMYENNELMYAYVNKAGEIVIGPYVELGQGNAQDDMLLYGVRDSTGYKEGYLDMKGNVIISPRFSHACDFSEGLAWAQMTEGDKYGYIDKTGEFVIQPKFDSADVFHKCGLAIVNQDNHYGVIDKTGNYILEPSYSNISIYDSGMIFFIKDEKIGFANSQGKIVYMEK